MRSCNLSWLIGADEAGTSAAAAAGPLTRAKANLAGVSINELEALLATEFEDNWAERLLDQDEYQRFLTVRFIALAWCYVSTIRGVLAVRA